MNLGLKESNEKLMKGYFFKCRHQFINDFQTKKEKLMLDIVVSTKNNKYFLKWAFYAKTSNFFFLESTGKPKIREEKVNFEEG